MTTLSSQWRAAGIERGDVVLLHSSSKRTLATHGITPQELLESFLDAVGADGCLVLPAFNFAWCRGDPPSLDQLESEMGVMSERARCDFRFTLTHHPVYRFAHYGFPRENFRDMNDVDAFGPNTMFDRLLGNDAKIAILDLPDQNAMTLYHHVEQIVGVSYRFHKSFRRGARECRVFVRGHGVETDVSGMESLLWERGHYKGDRPHVGGGLRTIRARAVFDETSAIIRAGKAEGMLWRRASA